MSTIRPNEPPAQPPDGGSGPPKGGNLTALVVAVLAFVSPTLDHPTWTPWLRAILALVVIALLFAGCGYVVHWLAS